MPHSNETQWARPSRSSRVLVPEVDAGLKADRDGTVGDRFEQLADLFADAEDLVDEVDVVHAAGDELVDFSDDL